MFKEFLIYLSSYLGLFAICFYFLGFYSKRNEIPPKIIERNFPKVSIIIPAFNEEKGIAGTLKSALEIDYPKDKLQIIVVDDGSSDKTYEIASKFRSKQVQVFKNKKNMGKGASMNFGISKSKADIIVTMDADNIIVGKDILKIMISNFTDPSVMCVAPTTAIYKPKGVLQRVQQVEYLLGVFLRRAFSSMNSIHITSGAFSVYRKSFFDENGGFSTVAITEDMEMALRIQCKGYRIVNDLRAIAFTVAPNKFVSLLKQRRRWYTGLLRCLLDYKRLFSRKYGAMGVIVLPVALITILFSIILTSYMIISTLWNIHKEIELLNSINFNFSNIFEFNSFMFEKLFYSIATSPISYFFVVFLLILVCYMVFAKRYVKEYSSIRLSLFFFMILYSFLFAFWWLVSIFYFLLHKKVVWR